MPKIDIVIPVFNGGNYINKCLISIANDIPEEFKGSRVIIVDDGSTDSSISILESLAIQLTDILEIKIIKNPKNMGITYSLNKGFSECIHKYVYRMDIDDIWMPGRLLTQYNVLKFGQVAIVGGQAKSMTGRKNKAYTPKNVSLYDFFIASPCIHPTLAINTNLIKEFFYRAESPFDDYYLLCSNLLLGNKIINIESKLIEYNDEKVPSRLSIIKSGNLHSKFWLIRIEILKLIILRCFWSSKLRKKNQYHLLMRLIEIIKRPEESKFYMPLQLVIFLNKTISKIARFFARA